jgi:hypothetical protein
MSLIVNVTPLIWPSFELAFGGAAQPTSNKNCELEPGSSDGIGDNLLKIPTIILL